MRKSNDAACVVYGLCCNFLGCLKNTDLEKTDLENTDLKNAALGETDLENTIFWQSLTNNNVKCSNLRLWQQRDPSTENLSFSTLTWKLFAQIKINVTALHQFVGEKVKFDFRSKWFNLCWSAISLSLVFNHKQRHFRKLLQINLG